LDQIARELEVRGLSAPGSSILADTALATRLERIYLGLSAWGDILDAEFDTLADLVAGLELKNLTDVDDALAPVANQVLAFVGGQWTSQTPAAVPLVLDDLTDVTIAAPAQYQFLRRGASQWQNETVAVYLKTGDTASGVHDFGGATSLEVPNGAGGTTVDAAGEICIDTTSKTLNFYDGVAEKVLNPERSKSITIEVPVAADSITVFFTNKAVTVSKMVAVLVGSATPSVAWTVRHGTDRSATGAEVVTGGTTTTSVSTGSVVTAFNDATIVADSFVWVVIGTVSGTVGQIHLTIFWTEDA